MLIVCGIFMAFQAAAGFLFGQLFAGHFSFAATLAGVAGLACAAGAFTLAAKATRAPPWIRWAAVLTLLGVALDVVTYYMTLAIPGNYYPWLLVGPFAACAAWVGFVAHRRRGDAS